MSKKLISQEELEKYIYDKYSDFDIDTWGDLRFTVCQDFIVDYVNFLHEKENERLEKQNEIFKSALEFYSDKNSIGYNTSVARKALEEIKELE